MKLKFHCGGLDKDLRANYEKYWLKISEEVRDRYKDQLERASYLERVFLYFKMKREVSKSVNERFDKGNLYLYK